MKVEHSGFQKHGTHNLAPAQLRGITGVGQVISHYACGNEILTNAMFVTFLVEDHFPCQRISMFALVVSSRYTCLGRSSEFQSMDIVAIAKRLRPAFASFQRSKFHVMLCIVAFN
jgi:hypothetical protein